jgi:peptidoglycan/LPS O-acetylase OafA/YrhL
MSRSERLAVLAGAALALGALWMPWYFNDDPPDTLNAWEVFVRADWLLAVSSVALALLALLPVARVRGVAAAGAWVLVGVCLDRVWAFSPSTPYPAEARVGPYVAAAGFALCGVGWSGPRRSSSDVEQAASEATDVAAS